MTTVNRNRVKPLFSFLLTVAVILICHFPVHAPLCHGARSKGIEVVIADAAGQRVGLYQGSYALLVGISDYTAGWPDLGSVPGELNRVEAVLKKQGFEVVKVMNPDSRGLKQAYEDFIGRYGYIPENRLLFFFSGHGHTRKGGTKGYLVPTDAPNPRRDEQGFLRKALPMNMILAWSRQLEARHALFLFDSCFSGTVFKAKALPDTPPHITRATALPVRQYITAGDAGETVPAKSVFTPAFIDALEYGWGDLNRDGYVSGTELGLYLQEKVPAHSRQNPQYGKIRDYDLARGDFVFQLASSGATVTKPDPSRKTTLSVSANVTGARVLVDGRSVGKTPLEDKSLSPGTHRLRVEADGYDAYVKRIRVESGRAVSLYVDLSEAAPSQGRLFVETTPGDARVRILNIGPAFFQGMDLDPGRYHVEVSSDGYETQKRWVSLSAGEDETVSMRLTAVRVAQPAASGEKRNSLGMEFVYVSPGSFMMGSPSGESNRDSDEKQHRVTLTREYYMQTTEVTQGQWRKVMGSNPSKFTNCGDNCPVEKVSWEDCQQFIQKLNGMEGTRKYRLPTEAEWEYAARAGTTGAYAGDLDAMAWYDDNSGGKTHAVGGKSPNAWGLYDMHGNVWEWCQDWKGDYPSGSVTDPTGPSSGSFRVDRGGCWRSFARYCRSAGRPWSDPGYRLNALGFRLAFSPGQ
jgi:formylglycine-generating enzyme required for sulfatase activity